MLGIGSVRKAASVGKVGGIALDCTSSAMSTVALGIGLLVGNLINPGDGLNSAADRRGRRLAEQAHAVGRSGNFFLDIIPTIAALRR